MLFAKENYGYGGKMGYRVLIILFCLLVEMRGLQANNAAWTNTTGGDWNTDSNWTAAHPDAVDAIAGFVGFPNSAGVQTITSTSNITVGSLVFDTTTPVTISLGNNLTFNRSSGRNAQIFASGDSTSTISTLTPVILNSDLDIFINGELNFFIQSSISGSGSLNLYGSAGITATDKLHLSGSNSYTGGTFITSGILGVEGLANTTVIPGDISVSLAGSVQHFRNNHYSSTTAMTINGGSVDLSGTTQSIKKLTVTLGGSFIDSFNSGILDLLALPGDAALTIGDNSQVNPFQINIINGGGIFYDSSRSGVAFLPGPTNIDLQGNSIDFHVPHNFNNCIDVDVGETVFQNGTLNKTGDGVVLFEGGTVPIFNINEGTVVIGDQTGSEVITATGLVTVTSPGILAGFQTLDAQMGVVNSGTIRPGNACSGCDTVGTLKIQGDHAQTSSGTLAIKALNAATSDLLVVDAGTVILNGELNFDALPGAVFNLGDKILILDNTNENTPITGTFSSFVYNLPPCLQATIIYNPHQVFVEISSCPCPPCPSSPPLPPSHFIGVIKKGKFLNKTECSLEAKWKASPSQDVVLYRIYKDGRIVGKVLATSPLVFEVRCLKDCSIKGYEIAAVNSNNMESSHVVLNKAKD